jgi:hypothetical protein
VAAGHRERLPKVHQSMLPRRHPVRNNIKHDIVPAMWEVIYLAEAEHERAELPTRDRVAVDHAVAKLEAIGPALPYPHSSNVEGSDDLRELRPRRARARGDRSIARWALRSSSPRSDPRRRRTSADSIRRVNLRWTDSPSSKRTTKRTAKSRKHVKIRTKRKRRIARDAETN